MKGNGVVTKLIFDKCMYFTYCCNTIYLIIIMYAYVYMYVRMCVYLYMMYLDKLCSHTLCIWENNIFGQINLFTQIFRLSKT